MGLLDIQDIYCGYESFEVIKGVSFSINEGSFVGIIGPNGAGKTTLFRAITRFLKPSKGRILFRDKNLFKYPARILAKEIAVLPQILDIPFAFGVYEFVMMGRTPHIPRFAGATDTDCEIVEKAMQFCDVLYLKDRKITELSGGERQRVIFAQALAQNPRLLLLDEPITHLDINYQIKIFELLRKVNQDGMTIMAIVHDVNFASEYCSQIIMLKDGRVFKQGNPHEIISRENLRDVFQVDVEIMSMHNKPRIIIPPKNNSFG